MYRNLYGLSRKPFQISTDPDFLWLEGRHKEALAVLVYGVRNNRGFLLLSGGVGTGKTTLIRSLLAQLDKRVAVALVTDPGLTPLAFFNFIAAAYGMQRRYTSKVDFLFDFEKFLRRKQAAGRTVLLIVDEAQRLDQVLLEEIRLLSNIEDPDRKLLNVFFVGQEEFLETLEAPENRALKQRITINYHLEPLTLTETEQMVRHRLKVAGATGEVFTPDVFPAIHAFSHGAPRLINILCDHALLTGFVRDTGTIDAAIIAECVDDLMLPGEAFHDRHPPTATSAPRPTGAAAAAGLILQKTPPPPAQKWPWAAAALLLLIIGAGVFWLRGGPGTKTAMVTPASPPSALEAAAPQTGRVAEDSSEDATVAVDETLPVPAAPVHMPEAGGSRPAGVTPGNTGSLPENGPPEESPLGSPLIGHEIPDPRPLDAFAARDRDRSGQVAAVDPAPVGTLPDQHDPAKDQPPGTADDNTASPPPGGKALVGKPLETAPAEAETPLPSPPEAIARPVPAPNTPADRAIPGAEVHAEAETSPPPPPEAVATPAPAAHTPADSALPGAGAPSSAPLPDPTETRIREFLDAYCQAYESLDLTRFRRFFAPDAVERGRPLDAVLPVYARNFDTLTALACDIDLTAWDQDPAGGTATLSGVFHIRYRRPQADWRTTRGAISMELVDTGDVLSIRRLDYEIKRSD